MCDTSGALYDVGTLPERLLLETPPKSGESRLLQNAVVEFVTRFRALALDERQLALFTTLVLCQCDATATGFADAALGKMLQERLWFVLQSALFPSRHPVHAVQGPMLVQSLFAALADLKTM